jgi:hypothetical protein
MVNIKKVVLTYGGESGVRDGHGGRRARTKETDEGGEGSLKSFGAPRYTAMKAL